MIEIPFKPQFLTDDRPPPAIHFTGWGCCDQEASDPRPDTSRIHRAVISVAPERMCVQDAFQKLGAQVSESGLASCASRGVQGIAVPIRMNIDARIVALVDRQAGRRVHHRSRHPSLTRFQITIHG